MNRKKKRALVVLGVLGLGAAVLAMGGSKAKAAADDDDLEDDDVEDDPADDEPEIPVRSPGIPQPPSVVVPPPVQRIPVPDLSGGIDLDEIDLDEIEPIPVNLPPPVFTNQPAPQRPAPAPTPAPPPVVVLPPQPPSPLPRSPLPPVPAAPTPIATLQPDTAELLAVLLAAEGSPGWKRKDEVVGVWQRNRGMTADSKFGPGSALKLALEASTIPIVRFWPVAAGARPDLALDDYRRALELIAQKSPPERAANLRTSAAREQGQSFGPPQGNNGKFAIAQTFAQGAP